MRVVLFGAYGFLGQNLIKKLSQASNITQIRVAIYGTDITINKSISESINASINASMFSSDNTANNKPNSKPHSKKVTLIRTEQLPEKLQFFSYNPCNQQSIDLATADMDVAINLIGILNQAQNNLQSAVTDFLSFTRINTQLDSRLIKKTYDFTHRQIPHKIAASCTANSPSHKPIHLIHISAQGAAIGSRCAYLHSKGQGEESIHSTENLDYTIIKPSLVIGKDANFVRRIAKAARLAYVMPLPLAAAKSQPIAISDLVTLIEKVISKRDEFTGKSLNAVGSEEMTMRQLIDIIIKSSLGKSRLIMPLPTLLAHASAIVSERLMKNPLISQDNIVASQEYKAVRQQDNHAFTVLGKLQPISKVLN